MHDYEIKSLILNQVFSALEVTEVSLFLCRVGEKHLLNERNVPSLDFISRGRMGTREVIGIVVMLQEGRLEVSECVLFTEEPPHLILIIRIGAVELMGFQFGKFSNQRLVDGEMLMAIGTR